MTLTLPLELDILDFIFKGIVIGLVASAPMGPVGILCVQRMVGLGMSFIMEPLQKPEYQFALQITGSILLLMFGVYCYLSNPVKKMHKSGKTKGTLWHNLLTAFLVTLSNPLIIFFFMALYAQFGFTCVPVGALLWWYGLTWLVDKIRGKFDVYGIIIINKVIGSIVVIFSLIILFGTVFNLYHLPQYY